MTEIDVFEIMLETERDLQRDLEDAKRLLLEAIALLGPGEE